MLQQKASRGACVDSGKFTFVDCDKFMSLNHLYNGCYISCFSQSIQAKGQGKKILKPWIHFLQHFFQQLTLPSKTKADYYVSGYEVEAKKTYVLPANDLGQCFQKNL